MSVEVIGGASTVPFNSAYSAKYNADKKIKYQIHNTLRLKLVALSEKRTIRKKYILSIEPTVLQRVFLRSERTKEAVLVLFAQAVRQEKNLGTSRWKVLHLFNRTNVLPDEKRISFPAELRLGALKTL